MVPLEVPVIELRQFGLLIKRMGADPRAFKLRKFAHPGRLHTTVHVHGRGAAITYEESRTHSWSMQFTSDLARGIYGQKPPALPSRAAAQSLALVRSRLAEGGVQAALQFLNERVRHRFTAAYRLDGDWLRAVAVIDKAGTGEAFPLREVPLGESFCQFVLKDGLFLTTESGNDARLNGHRYRGVVACYAGVPIQRSKHGIYGSLCHFDYKSEELRDEEFLFLERVARVLPDYLPQELSSEPAG